MSLSTIRQTIENLFYDNWTSTNRDTHVRYSNVFFDPPVDENWVSIDIRWLPTKTAAISSKLAKRRKGVLFIDIYTAIDNGTGDLTALADEAIALFENRQESVTTDSVGTAINFMTAEPRHTGVPNIQGTDPQWYKYSVRIPFYRDE